jgi:hypothetical protein
VGDEICCKVIWDIQFEWCLGHPYNNSAPQFLQRGDTPFFGLAPWALPAIHGTLKSTK